VGLSPPDFDPLLDLYQRYRTGYPPELFARVLAACPAGALRVLDVASGTGLGAEGLAPRASLLVAADVARGMLRANPAAHGVQARAEALPFRDASFDLVACAQAFHWVEPAAALAEMRRVLAPRGVAALWWKYEAADDPTAQLADAVVARALGRAPHTPLAREGALPGLEGSAFAAEEVRLRHAVAFDAARYAGYQASREILRRAAGEGRERMLAGLRDALAHRHGERPFDVAHVTRLFLLRKR
jgi:SAM-dependent methyltransferase